MNPAILAMIAMVAANLGHRQPKPRPVPAHDDFVAFAVAKLAYNGLPVRSEWRGKI